jgi:YD repeat-containing protein
MCYFRCSLFSRTSLVFVPSVLFALFLPINAYGQAPNINSLSADTAIPQAGKGHEYIHMLAETVNPASGSVNFTIAFPTQKGRGISPQYKLLYNSSSAYHLTSAPFGALNFTPSPSIYGGGGWTDNTPVAKWTENFWQAPDSPTFSPYFALFPGAVGYYQGNGVCSFASNFTFSDFQGATQNLNLGEITLDTTFPNPINAPCPASGGGPPKAGNGSVYAAFLNSQTLLSYMAGWSSTAGANWTVVTSGNVSPFVSTFVVNDAAGTKFVFANPTAPVPSPTLDADFVVESYGTTEDKNGNEFSWSSDTLGRPIVSSKPPLPVAGESQNVSQATTIGGINYNFSINSSAGTGSYTVPISGGPTITGVNNFELTCPSVNGNNWKVVTTDGGKTSIGIPSTPESFLTYYWGNYSDQAGGVPNPYNLVSEIIYPSGGWVQYSWTIPTSVPGAGTNQGQWQMAAYAAGEANNDGGQWVPTGTLQSGCVYWYSMPVLATRVVSYDGSTKAQTQNYQYSTTWPSPLGSNWTSKQTTVTTLDNKTGITTTAVFTYAPALISPQPNTIGQNNAQIPVETLEQYYDGTGTSNLVRTVAKSWYSPDLMASEQTTENGETSTVTYCYSPPAYSGGASELRCSQTDAQIIQSPPGGVPNSAAVPLLLEKHEFDYGVNPLAGASPSRKTVYTYEFFPSPSTIITPAGTTIPASDVLAPQVATEKVYDRKGNLLAETDYGYDESSLVNTTGIVGHDDANYPQGWTVRGNLTSVHKCSVVASNACSSYATTTYTYDITGQTLSMTDPLRNKTTYSYADNPPGGNAAGSSNAYLTTITDALGYSEQFAYNYPSGELASSMDENNQTTTYSYADPLLRVTDIYGPLSSQNGAKPHTHYAYVDGSGTSVTTTNPIGVASTSYSDGIGHVIETQVASDPNGTDTVNITYNGEGQVYTKTNPFRGMSPPANTTTTYYYDALGRPIETSEQDGNKLQWCYNGVAATGSTPTAIQNCSSQLGSVKTGSWVDSTDENGNHWQRTTDAFGRLTEVMEPSGASQAPSMETDYAYDGLDNLLSVSQCGALCATPAPNGPIARSFQYDGLSRLLSATNPETGRVNYTYDSNGNLLTKTDSRGVTTSYQYDQLNRVLGKSYSGDVSKTPLSCYQYGTSTTGNTIGRLINEWTLSVSSGTSCPTASPFLTKRSISTYDEMGRIIHEQQFTPASQASGKQYLPQYTYDLAGNLTSSTDGIAPSPNQSWSSPCSNSPTPGTGAPLTFVNCYDTAGHLQSVTSNWNDGTHPPSVFVATPNSSLPSYTAFGGLQNATLAGSNGITLSRAYDNRLRIIGETDTSSSNHPATSGAATVTIIGTEQSH